jgi:DNA uptake protein ComE-like DNA-binding protein
VKEIEACYETSKIDEPIRGAGLIFHSSTSLRLARITLIGAAVLWAAVVDLGAREGSKDWIVLENCRLLTNAANDGDSFHVSVNGKEYVFRLYFVDAPETDAADPLRLVEQAKHFGVTVPQVIEIGEAAKAFAREKLAEPFAVTTRMANAMGRGSAKRFYAFVQTKDGDLGEQLVANGLARIHGTSAPPPGASSSAAEREKLAQFEEKAKRRKIGGWGMSGRPSSVASATSRPTDAAHSISVTPTSGSSTGAVSPVETKTSHAKEKTPLGKIDINTATEKELTTVPGIGHVMAARIIAARPFRSADDLRRVSGIGDQKYAQIRPYFQ